MNPIFEPVPNHNPERDYVIRVRAPEFTCLCPRTGQPDFATIEIDYTPDRTIVELKSLKLYLQSYRNQGTFHEAVTNKILDDLIECLRPRWMEVRGVFGVRGGISTTVVAAHGSPRLPEAQTAPVRPRKASRRR